MIAAVVALAIASCSSDGSDEPTAAGTAPAATVPPTVAPTTLAATTETGTFVGSAEDVPFTFTMPAGWENSGWGAIKGDPIFGFATAEVGNIYTDPCQWVLVPSFGPTVDDLVSAWANVPGFDATATSDITVDGYAGKQIEFTVPDYNMLDCKGGRYGIWQEPAAHGTEPALWAQGPNPRGGRSQRTTSPCSSTPPAPPGRPRVSS